MVTLPTFNNYSIAPMAWLPLGGGALLQQRQSWFELLESASGHEVP
jgi:predicted oxidoreductase